MFDPLSNAWTVYGKHKGNVAHHQLGSRVDRLHQVSWGGESLQTNASVKFDDLSGWPRFRNNLLRVEVTDTAYFCEPCTTCTGGTEEVEKLPKHRSASLRKR